MVLTRRDITDLLKRHGLAPSRALGQNFVADPNTVRRIAHLARVGPGDAVVEIGPGLGSLTLALAETGADVTAVEVDRHLVPVLRDVVGGSGVRVIEGDALSLDWEMVLAEAQPWTLVANLPYNVGTSLVLDLLDSVPVITRMLVMVQREVGERLAAQVGTPGYGIPSVKVAYHGRAKVVGRVPATVFVPRPRVESVLVEIERFACPTVTADNDVLFELVRTAFSQRRKMLRRSLASVVMAPVFEAAGISSEDRPEQLDIEQWGRLTDAVVRSRGMGGENDR